MPKVLVTARSFRQARGEHWRILEQAGIEVIAPSGDYPLAEAEMIPLVGNADGILVGNDEVTERVLRAATRTKVVSRQGVGVDNIDVAAATRAGIVVTNTPGANQEAVAELAIGLLLALVRRIPYHDTVVKGGGWGRQTGIELADKTIGVIGLGRIGKEVVLRLKGFRVRLLAYDVYQDEAFASEHDLRFVPLDFLLSESDVVMLHAALTRASRHLIGKSEIGRMKRSAYLINTSRGELIDEEALYHALAEDRLAGAALDVFENEPPKASSLLKLGDKVILSPHLGAQTGEAVLRMSCMAAQNAVQVLRGERPGAVVNPQVYENEQVGPHQGAGTGGSND